MSTALSAREAALASGRAYGLFGQLFLHGLTPTLFAVVETLPELAAAALPYDPDEAAAAFYALLGMNVPPYQSLFLDDTGLLGGSECDRVRESYREMGFAVDEANEPADHLGHELLALSHLCLAEADAWEDGHMAMVARIRRLEKTFLTDHLLRWLPTFVMAVRRQGPSFYAHLATLTLELALARWQPAATTPPSPPVPASSLTPRERVARLLADPNIGLAEIAGFLLTPVYSGLYLSRDDIGRLARAVDVPTGFGERRQMLRTLLQGAAVFDCWQALLAALSAVVDEFAAGYERFEGTPAAVLMAPWQERLAATRALVGGMGAGKPNG
ncbi:MAG: molecular chaperone TorD family protein [Caldilineales bacterium]|nr:molecular chaperone TorD family protein [Caldilineales bacterium]